jgi:hypothetical protein
MDLLVKEVAIPNNSVGTSPLFCGATFSLWTTTQRRNDLKELANSAVVQRTF